MSGVGTVIVVAVPDQLHLVAPCLIATTIVRCSLQVPENLLDGCPMMRARLLHESAKLGGRNRVTSSAFSDFTVQPGLK